MELLEFAKKVQKALQEYYGDEAQIKSQQVYKNNGILLHGVCVMEKDKNVAPTIYLNELYRQYENGETFGNVIKQIIEMNEDYKVTKNFNMNFFLDYENVKKRLVLRLIHGEKNKELLKSLPHQKYMDLAVVCYCMVESEEIGAGTILIHKNHMEEWHIDEETLFHDAFFNSPKIEPYQIMKMSDMVKMIIENMIAEQAENFCLDEEQKEEFMEKMRESMVAKVESQNIPMYVLTNASRYYGAACILYPNVLEKIEQLFQDDFYILPSSVHEVILLGKKESMDSCSLNEMIQEINQTQVARDEWLSDHTYLYQKKDKRLIPCENSWRNNRK